MREFRAEDGQAWRARLDAGPTADGAWEIVLFEPHTEAEMQRIIYRPSGWLQSAAVQELIAALKEAEAVRTRWGG